MVVETPLAAGLAVDEPEVVMKNGFEYWKVVGSESREILIPYVAKLGMLAGMSHTYEPKELSTPDSITSPKTKVDAVTPCRRVRVTVPG